MTCQEPKAAAGVRRKQEGSGDLEGVIRVRRTGGSDVLASGCANERSISRGLLRVSDTMNELLEQVDRMVDFDLPYVDGELSSARTTAALPSEQRAAQPTHIPTRR